MTGDFDAAYAALLAAVDETLTVLWRFDKRHWAEWLAQDRERIARGDVYGLDHLLQAFGGMGSLNDVYIHRVNGDDVSDDEAATINAELNELRERVWVNAKALRRDLSTG